MFLRSLAAATLTILMLGVQPASARITSLELAPPEPFAAGASFGDAGASERVIGKVRGELDPADPRNAGIADIALAPRNAKGMVLYTTDFFMLRPKDAAKGSHTLVYEVLNRGRKFLLKAWIDAVDYASAERKQRRKLRELLDDANQSPRAASLLLQDEDFYAGQPYPARALATKYRR